MPLRYTIDETARIVRLTFEGAVTYPEFAETMAVLFADERYERGLSFLADRRLAAVPTSEYAKQVVAFLERHAESFGPSRWGTVVDGPAAYGMIRIIETRTSRLPVEIRVFTNLTDTLDWLGLEPDYMA